VFYGSLAAPAVFYELKVKEGDLVALSEWLVVEPLWMHHLGYHQDALRKLGVIDVGARQWLANPIQNESERNARLRRQLSLAFTEDVPEGQEYRYKRPIAINELLFDGASPLPTPPDGPKSSQAAGTVYPGLKMRGAADNVAIWPRFVDSSLRIKSVRYVLVEAADEAKSSYTFLTLAFADKLSDRDIIWQEILLSDIQRRSHIALEGDDWVLRDGFGHIYYRHRGGGGPRRALLDRTQLHAHRVGTVARA
jgi:hypothetical protein